jgi:hypothetical protein
MQNSPNAESETARLEAPLPLPRKCACADCRVCQLCSDSRCNCCRSAKTPRSSPKMSFSEQIRLYEQTNVNDPFLKKRCK